MNKVILIGRLTKDPETKFTSINNKQVTSFSLAVPKRFKQEGQDKADFINIVAWNKTAEFCSKYFQKGQQVGVVGRLQIRNYEDENKVKHYVTEVIAEEVYFADSKKEGTTTTTASEFEAIQDDDELPF